MGFTEVKERMEEIQKAVDDCSVLISPSDGRIISDLNIQTGLHGMETYAQSLKKLSATLKNSMFKVMFMGTFKNGKSTTINALIGERLLPVGVTATTAVISQVVYGTNTDKVKVFKTDVAEPEEIKIEDFNEKYKLTHEDITLISQNGSIDRFGDINYVLLENDCELLRNRVIVIDSPGLEENISRTKATNQFFPQANAIVFLLDAQHMFSAKEKEFIQAHFSDVEPKPRNVFFLVNRINQLNDEDDLAAVKTQVRTVLAPVFTVDNNLDKNLFDKRLFFVDSYHAYKLKKEKKPLVGGEGITEFKRFQEELETFLTSDD